MSGFAIAWLAAKVIAAALAGWLALVFFHEYLSIVWNKSLKSCWHALRHDLWTSGEMSRDEAEVFWGEMRLAKFIVWVLSSCITVCLWAWGYAQRMEMFLLAFIVVLVLDGVLRRLTLRRLRKGGMR